MLIDEHYKKIKGMFAMYLKYSIWFAIASIVQAGIVLASERLGLSTLGIVLTPTQFLIHIIAGQMFGYLLLVTIRKVKFIREGYAWLSGAIMGVIAWLVLYSFNSAIGAVTVPWTQGLSTILSSLTAYLVFGLIVAYTIKKIEHNAL